MNRRDLSLPILIVLFAAFTGSLFADPKPAGKSLAGVVVSCEAGVLMLSTRETQAPVAVALAPDTFIYINNALAKPADIKPGGNAVVHQIDGITTRVDINYKKGG